MKLGAKGYLTKKCAGENIIQAIEAVCQDQEYYSDAVKEKYSIHLHLILQNQRKIYIPKILF